MTSTTIAAIKAAIEFLHNDEARDLLGLHRVRVNGDMMTRGQVAAMLQAAMAAEPHRDVDWRL